MKKRAKKADSEESASGIASFITESTRYAIIGIICLAVGFFFILASLGFAGVVGAKVFSYLQAGLGIGYFALPLVALLLAVACYKAQTPNLISHKLWAALLSFVAILGLIGVIFRNSLSAWNGGWLGQKIATLLFKLFGSYSSILLIAVIIIAQMLMFDGRLNWQKLSPLFWWRHFRGRPEDGQPEDEGIENMKVAGNVTDLEETTPETTTALAEKKDGTKTAEEASVFSKVLHWSQYSSGDWQAPPLNLLEKDSGKPTAGDVKAQANIIKRTLANFGIVVEMDEVSIGPSITRFAFKPAEGVKLSRIIALQNDLSLALAAHPLRIEAPIPGKSLVGIEIPNSTKSIVGLASLVGSKEFSTNAAPLLVSLGRGITGSSHFANLVKAPHMLIAGTTGSGKSVVIHSFITSLLYRNAPDNLRFIMIDPKRVELSVYNRVPHLLTPVVTDPKKAILVLKWAIKEMERRYGVLETSAVRDIQSYHQTKPTEDRMPYIVVIIDELADIMSTYPRELEAAIVRLAQMSRAVGIHLVLSTQRPSVEVITGLIKANVPSRVALQVASQIDSRTILDMAGAEKLLGAGDMLYLAGDMAKPVRLQSAFISENEVKKVADYLAKNSEPELGGQISLTENNGHASMNLDWEAAAAEDEADDLYEEARELVIAAGKASASYLQRRLKVGYARAARLLDMLEERGVIGPGEGAKQREVYVKNEETSVQPEP